MREKARGKERRLTEGDAKKCINAWVKILTKERVDRKVKATKVKERKNDLSMQQFRTHRHIRGGICD